MPSPFTLTLPVDGWQLADPQEGEILAGLAVTEHGRVSPMVYNPQQRSIHLAPNEPIEPRIAVAPEVQQLPGRICPRDMGLVPSVNAAPEDMAASVRYFKCGVCGHTYDQESYNQLELWPR